MQKKKLYTNSLMMSIIHMILITNLIQNVFSDSFVVNETETLFLNNSSLRLTHKIINFQNKFNFNESQNEVSEFETNLNSNSILENEKLKNEKINKFIIFERTLKQKNKNRNIQKKKLKIPKNLFLVFRHGRRFPILLSNPGKLKNK